MSMQARAMRAWTRGVWTGTCFVEIHNTLAPMQGYAPIPTMDHEGACRAAFMNVRKDVWDDRESRLRATWESYG